MSKVVMHAFCLIICLLLAPVIAQACECVPDDPGEPLKEKVLSDRAWAGVVFSGEVVKMEDDEESGKLAVHFKVSTWWKHVYAKEFPAEIVIYTARNTALCGYPFREGGKYLVFGGEIGRAKFNTRLCSPTMGLSGADEELKILGEGEPPTKAKAAPERP